MEGRQNYHKNCWPRKVKIILQVKMCSSVDKIKNCSIIMILSMHQVHFANPRVRLDRGAGSHQNCEMEKGESTGQMDLLPLTKGQQRSRNGAGAQKVCRKGLWQTGRNTII